MGLLCGQTDGFFCCSQRPLDVTVSHPERLISNRGKREEGEAGGDRSRFKTSYRRRLKGWNILRASDGKQEAKAGLARKPGYFTSGLRPAPHMKAALGVCIKEYTLRV